MRISSACFSPTNPALTKVWKINVWKHRLQSVTSRKKKSNTKLPGLLLSDCSTINPPLTSVRDEWVFFCSSSQRAYYLPVCLYADRVTVRSPEDARQTAVVQQDQWQHGFSDCMKTHEIRGGKNSRQTDKQTNRDGCVFIFKRCLRFSGPC